LLNDEKCAALSAPFGVAKWKEEKIKWRKPTHKYCRRIFFNMNYDCTVGGRKSVSQEGGAKVATTTDTEVCERERANNSKRIDCKKERSAS